MSEAGRARGPLIVAAVALATGALVMWARRPVYPDAKLPGPCEVVQTISYPGDIPPSTERTMWAYDERGNKIEEQRGIGDAPSTTTRWEYDDDDNPILETRTQQGPIHSTGSDGNTHLLENSASTVRWTYDEQGRVLTREYFRRQETEIPHRTRFSYDADGRKVAAHATWEGKYESDTEFEYDEAGNLVAERNVGSAIGATYYQYDGSGQVIRETFQMNARGEPDRIIVRSYDDRGRETRTEIRESGVEQRVITRTFDDHGNLLEEIEAAENVDGSSVQVRSRYEYGCWTQRGDAVVYTP